MSPVVAVRSERLVAVVAVVVICLLAVAMPARASVQFKLTGSAGLGAAGIGGVDDVPVDVKMADVNGDGEQDVLAATRASGVWLYGGGAGSAFSIPSQSTTVAASLPSDVPTALCVGTFDAGARPDFVVPMSGGSAKVGLWNAGIGAYGNPPASVATGLGSPTSCAVGDLDGDGDLDIAIGAFNGVRILTNSGGTFTAGPTLTTSGQVGAVAIADVNGAGGNDVIATRTTGVDVWLQGAFGAAPATLTMTGTALYGLAVADFDGKNGPDIAVAADNTGGTDFVRVRLNLGGGTFSGDAGYQTVAAPRRLSVDDFSKDNIPDLLTVAASENLATLTGSGSLRGAFDPPGLISGTRLVSATSGNFDDSVPDLVTVNTVASPPPYQINFFTSAGAGVFSPGTLNFPVVTVITGAPYDAVATLTSLGTPPLKVNGLSLAGQDALSYSVLSDGCTGRVLAQGATCPITIRFLPQHVGPSPAQLNVTTDGASDPTPLQLVANGGGGVRPAAPANLALPTITGTAEEGKTLTCHAGTWSDPTASFDYFWARGGAGIEGASDQTYTIQYLDVGFELTCRAFASSSGGRTAAISKGVRPVDRTTPKCTLKVSDQNLPTVRSKGIQVTAQCSEPVTAKFRMSVSKKDRKRYRLRTTTLGTDEQKFENADKQTLRVLMDATPRSRLKKAKRLKITVTLAAVDRVNLDSKTQKVSATAKK